MTTGKTANVGSLSTIKRIGMVLSILAAATIGLGFSGDNAPNPEQPQPERELLSSVYDAVELASENLAFALQEHKISVPHTIRYLWIDNAGLEEWQIGSLWLHMISTNSLFKQPARAAQGFLARVDLSDYANDDPGTLQRLLDTWEELRFDPAFHENLIDDDGKVVVQVGGVNKVTWGKLCQILKTQAPVVSLPYFITRVSSAIQDQGGNNEIYGGLYYKFTGLGDEKDVLAFLGVGDGGSLSSFYTRLPSLRKVGIRKSVVTGKERIVNIFPTEARETGAWGAVTEDPADGRAGGKNSPLKNLLGFKPDAKEGIFVTPLGLHWFTLWNGEGKRQDEAPNKVVSADMFMDSLGHRNPHSTRLQPAISCISCHWALDDADGWRPLHNDVRDAMLRGVFAFDGYDRGKLERLYQGPDIKLILRAKADLSEAVLRATGTWAASQTQADVVKLAGRKTVQVYSDYLYSPVDARIVLRESGVIPPKDNKHAAAILAALIPPAKVGEAEDLDLDDLRAGKTINRFDWDVIRARAGKAVRR